MTEPPAGQLCRPLKLLLLYNVGSLGHAPRAVVGKVGAVPSEGSKGSRLHKTELIFKAAKLFRFLPVHSCVVLKRP